MMKHLRLVALSLTVWTVLALSPSARAENLVFNGDFETGDLSYWTSTGSYTGITSTPGHVHSGTYAYEAGPYPTYADLSQVVSGLQVGSTYEVSFWLKSPGTPSDATVTFGSDQLLNLSSPGSFTPTPDTPFVNYTYQVTAASSSETLDFQLRTSPDYWYLDDVSVSGISVPIPEPAFYQMSGLLVLGGLGLLRARRRK